MAKKYFIAGKEEVTDANAPVISNEFIDTTREEGEYRGQTIEVKSDTKLESDTGVGEAVVLRTYEFAANPEFFKNGLPNSQDVFDSHLKGIMAMLWQDGLQPAHEVEPKLIFSKGGDKYLIMIGARPSVGHSILEKPQTLTEIIHASRKDRNTLQRSVPVSPAKKKASKRAAKASE